MRAGKATQVRPGQQQARRRHPHLLPPRRLVLPLRRPVQEQGRPPDRPHHRRPQHDVPMLLRQQRGPPQRAGRPLAQRRTAEGQDAGEMVALILDSLSPFAGYVRLHVSGDFFSQDYFDAWVEVARHRPRTLFYAYTKACPTGSAEGRPARQLRPDRQLRRHARRPHRASTGCGSARVVLVGAGGGGPGAGAGPRRQPRHERGGADFALLIHGTSRAGRRRRRPSGPAGQGEFGYGERADKRRAEAGRKPLAMVS